MEFLILFAIGFLIRGSLEHSKGDRAQSRAQRVKEVAKSHPKGSLSKSQQKAAARRHATGWWAREVRHFFPVHRTGWHAAWLAHKAQAHAHDTRREEAAADAAEAEVARKLGVSGARQRRAAAQAELDKIEAELAAQQAKGSPATGKRAVREAADEVSRKRKEREQATGPRCPSCGAPEGYDHLPGCDPTAPPLPADSVRRADPVVIDTPVRLHNAEDSAHLNPGDKRCEGCGGSGRHPDGRADACPVCRGWGSGPPDPASPLAADDAVCTACGNTGKPGDPVLADPGGNIHLSHAQEQQEAYWDRLNRLRQSQRADDGPGADAARWDPDIDGTGTPAPSECVHCHRPIRQSETSAIWWAVDGHQIGDDTDCLHEPPPEPVNPTASPTTQGAPMSSAETTYRQVLQYTDDLMAGTEVAAVQLGKDVTVAGQVAEDLQGAEADGATISAQMELADRLRTAEASLRAVQEQAEVVKHALQAHSGLQEAHDNAPVRAAHRDFYQS